MPDSRKIKTRGRIREAANRLFLEHGFEDTTVDSIVEAANVSKGTFYTYFKRKEDLLLEYGWRRLEHMRALLPTSLGVASFEEALSLLVTTVIRDKTWSPEVIRLTINEMNQSPGLAESSPHLILKPLIEVAQARGQVRQDLPAETLARFVLRNVLGALQEWSGRNDGEPVDTALDRGLMLIFAALTPSDDQ